MKHFMPLTSDNFFVKEVYNHLREFTNQAKKHHFQNYFNFLNVRETVLIGLIFLETNIFDRKKNIARGKHLKKSRSRRGKDFKRLRML